MFSRAAVVLTCALLGCARLDADPAGLDQAAPLAGDPAVDVNAQQGPGGEGTPLTGDLTFTVTAQQWAGVPSVDRSTFAGRCSIPSDYVVTATISGELTHLGRLVPTSASHCTQLQWGAIEGAPTPVGATYSDGRWGIQAANGDELWVTYGAGVVTAGPSGGTFRDEFTILGGTGRFRNATGGGTDLGTFAGLTDPSMPMRMNGTITFGRRDDGEKRVSGEFRGRTVEFYTVADPEQRGVVQQQCGGGAQSFTVGRASGTLTYLGRTDLLNQRCQFGALWTASVTLTAANGDRITGAISGGGTAPDAAGNYTWYADPMMLTGGTGRFADVALEGSWTGGGNLDGSGYSTLEAVLRQEPSS